jgi:hypothetical protein
MILFGGTIIECEGERNRRVAVVMLSPKSSSPIHEVGISTEAAILIAANATKDCPLA